MSTTQNLPRRAGALKPIPVPLQNGPANDMIRIRGARENNLKNINIDIPRNKIVVITGLSGSGKSSLAFDTIYAEGQRRYLESLSSYARQFLEKLKKPDAGPETIRNIEEHKIAQYKRGTDSTTKKEHY